MNSPYGVSVTLFKDGLQVHPDTKGYLGQFFAGDQIEMHISLDRSKLPNAILVTSNRERQDVKELKSQSGEFVHTVPVIAGPKGTKFFDRDDVHKNCVHLVEMDDKGLVQVTNIVVIAQDENFFLLSIPTFRAQAYQGEQSVATPALWIRPGFPDLLPFIDTSYKARPSVVLPSIDTYVPPPELEPEVQAGLDDLKDPNQLVVKFWSGRTNTGGALRKNAAGDVELVKIYYKNINAADRFPRYVLQGEIIRAGNFRPTRSGDIEIEAVAVVREQFDAVAAE